MSEEINKYDNNGNLKYYKYSDGREGWAEYDNNNNNLIYCKFFNGTEYGTEYWEKYDENNNKIYVKCNDGTEYWGKYDKNNNLIYQKNTNNFEEWYEYNKTGMRIKITKQEFENIKIREYMSREKVSRFELMEI